MQTLTCARTNAVYVHCSKLQKHSKTQHKNTRTHIFPQICNSGLREGITQTNKEQGKGSWESLERQQSSQHSKMGRRERAEQRGGRQAAEWTKCIITLSVFRKNANISGGYMTGNWIRDTIINLANCWIISWHGRFTHQHTVTIHSVCLSRVTNQNKLTMYSPTSFSLNPGCLSCCQTEQSVYAELSIFWVTSWRWWWPLPEEVSVSIQAFQSSTYRSAQRFTWTQSGRGWTWGQCWDFRVFLLLISIFKK